MALRPCTVSVTDPSGVPLSQLEVLVVDGQATAAAPRGHLLEIGWAQVRHTVTHPHACLIAVPDGSVLYVGKAPALHHASRLASALWWV